MTEERSVPLVSVLESDVEPPTPYVYDCSFLVKSGRMVRVLSNGWSSWPWPQSGTTLIHTWEEARSSYRNWRRSHQIRVRYLRPGTTRSMGFAGATLAVEDLWVPFDYLHSEPLNLPGVPSTLYLERPHTRSSVTPFCVRGVAIRGLDILEMETAWVNASVLPYRIPDSSFRELDAVRRLDPFSVRLVRAEQAREASTRALSLPDLLAWWETMPLLEEYLAQVRSSRTVKDRAA